MRREGAGPVPAAGPVVLVAGLVLAVGLVLGACGVDPETTDRRVSAGLLPGGLLDPVATTTTTTTTVPPSTTVPPPSTSVRPTTTLPYSFSVFFIRGQRIVPVRRELAVAPDVAAVLDELLDGPRRAFEAERVLRTAVSPELVIASAVTVAGGVATVSLTEAFTREGSSQQLLALAQLVYSVTSAEGVGQVRFLLGGQPVAVPLPDSSLVIEPVSRDAYASLLAPDPSSPVPSTVASGTTVPPLGPDVSGPSAPAATTVGGPPSSS
jgi:hypothetical protein